MTNAILGTAGRIGSAFDKADDTPVVMAVLTPLGIMARAGEQGYIVTKEQAVWALSHRQHEFARTFADMERNALDSLVAMARVKVAT